MPDHRFRRLRFAAVTIPLAVAAVSTMTACSPGTDPVVPLPVMVGSDGERAFAHRDIPGPGFELTALDADSSVLWKRQLAPGPAPVVAGDAIWVVVKTPDRLLRLDPATGETTGEVALGSDVSGPPLPVNEELWFFDRWDAALTIIDTGSVAVIDVVAMEPPIAPTRATHQVRPRFAPVTLDGDVYLRVGGGIDAILRIPAEARRPTGVFAIEPARFGTAWLEVAAGRLWMVQPERGAGRDDDHPAPVGRLLVHELDPDSMTPGDPVPYFDSPVDSLETARHVFDVVDDRTIHQISRSTGGVLRVMEIGGGRSPIPAFVLDDELWTVSLHRHPIADP